MARVWREKVPKLTKKMVEEALRKSAKGANELNKLLESCFRLNERSANLRLY